MAPALTEIFRRYYYTCDVYGDCYYSTWDSWGRWVLLGGVLVFVFFLAFILTAVRSRRRRRAGLQPYYGTGWIAGRAPVYNNPGYYGPPAPAPPYTAPVNNQHTGTTFNTNDGYYGQQGGVELQQPKNAYAVHGGVPVR